MAWCAVLGPMPELLPACPAALQPMSQRLVAWPALPVPMPELLPACPATLRPMPQRLVAWPALPVPMPELLPACPATLQPMPQRLVAWCAALGPMPELLPAWPTALQFVLGIMPVPAAAPRPMPERPVAWPAALQFVLGIMPVPPAVLGPMPKRLPAWVGAHPIHSGAACGMAFGASTCAGDHAGAGRPLRSMPQRLVAWYAPSGPMPQRLPAWICLPSVPAVPLRTHAEARFGMGSSSPPLLIPCQGPHVHGATAPRPEPRLFPVRKAHATDHPSMDLCSLNPFKPVPEPIPVRVALRSPFRPGPYRPVAFSRRKPRPFVASAASLYGHRRRPCPRCMDFHTTRARMRGKPYNERPDA